MKQHEDHYGADCQKAVRALLLPITPGAGKRKNIFTNFFDKGLTNISLHYTINTDNTNGTLIMRSQKLSVYLQIVEDVKRKIALGFLKPGDRLPSCRDLAAEMGINPNTVQHSYSTLEKEGFIYTQPKKGVYVAQPEAPADPDSFIRNKIKELKDAGAASTDVLRIVSEIYGDE